MANPKGFKKDIKLTRDKVGPERRQELLDNIANQGTFLPRGIYYEDMDDTFKRFVEQDLKIVIDGEEVPVVFLTLQRWNEFSQTWQFADKFKDIQLPFITIVRRPDPQVGTNQAGLWNVPQGKRTYTYMKVPTWDGQRKGVDVYKIPQPTSVDITYEVRLFCNRMRDLNKLNLIVQKLFQSRQHYVRVNGHPIPLTLENIGDESNISDIEKRRFYVQQFEILMAGYVLDEEDFEVIPAVSRALVFDEIIESKAKPKIKVAVDEEAKIFNCTIVHKAGSDLSFDIPIDMDVKFNSHTLIKNVSSIDIKKAGVPQTFPFVVYAGETLKITIVKPDFSKDGKFVLTGNVL